MHQLSHPRARSYSTAVTLCPFCQPQVSLVGSKVQHRSSAETLSVSIQGWVWVQKAYLAFRIGPEIYNDPSEIIQRRVGALIHEACRQSSEWIDDQSSLHAPVQAWQHLNQRCQRPLPATAQDSKQHVEDLQYWEWFDRSVEVFGEKVPEDLGPEEGRDASHDLIHGSRQDDETSPVVFDEFAHGGGDGGDDDDEGDDDGQVGSG